MPRRPFRFGVQCPGTGMDGPSWVALARHVEALGYSTLTMPDHFFDQLAPVPALTAAAMATERLRVGAMVWCNDFRHPVLFAKELATLDVLSGGRVEIGLGAGWMTDDYSWSGIALDPPSRRIERMAEAVAVLRGCLSGEEFSFDGDHYRIAAYRGTPLPVQRPMPPLVIGGGGRRVLTLAGREADVVGVNANLAVGELAALQVRAMLPAAVEQRLGWVRDGAGDRFPQLELTVRVVAVAVTSDRRGAAEAIGAPAGLSADEVLSSAYALVGTVGQIADTLRERRQRWGFSYVVVSQHDVEDFAPVVAELTGT